MTTKTRHDEIQDVHKTYKWFYPFIGGLIILIVGFIFGIIFFGRLP